MGSARSKVASRRFPLGRLLVATIFAAGLEAQTPADSAWSRGDLAAARPLYEERVARDSTDDVALFRLGLIAAWTRDFELSLDLLHRLLELTPQDIDAHLARARVLAWKGDLAEALPALERAIAVEPTDRRTHRLRAQILAWNNRLDAASALYDSLVITDATDVEAQYGAALVSTWRWRFGAADSLYQSILEKEPGDLRALQGQARLLAWRGQLVNAEAAWTRLLERDPESVVTLVGLAQVLRWQGRNSAAYDVIAAAQAAAPYDRDVQDEYEWVQSRTGARLGATAVYESDSDRNRMFTLSGAANWPMLPGIQVEAQVYRRHAELRGSPLPDAVSSGLLILGQKTFAPGWGAVFGTGVTTADAAASRDVLRLLASVATPRRYALSGSLAFQRFALDATGPQIASNVHVEEVRLGAEWRANHRWSVSGAFSLAAYDGTESNRRAHWEAAGFHHLTPAYSLGAVSTFFSFQKDLLDGYFDPDFFGLIEAEGRAHWQFGRRVTVEMRGGPGLQMVGSDGSIEPTIRVQSRLTYLLMPGRELHLDGSVSSAGVRSFATGDSDYRYGALGISFGWIF